MGHAAACVSGSLLVMVGGRNTRSLSEYSLSECWICDTATMLWSKVIHLSQIDHTNTLPISM